MPGKYANNYALLISERRNELGMTQKQVADRIGVTRRTYQSIEYGKMSLAQLILVCDVLGLTVLLVPAEYLD